MMKNRMIKPVLYEARIAILLVMLITGIVPRIIAKNPPYEGMWLPILIERLNYVDMQKMGLHLSADELYSINHSSLKDAIVGLSNGSINGFFCTAEVVSDNGLIFTNHHCGFDAVENHSTPEHDYLTNGFWAMSKNDELKNDNLCASFLVRMEDVTDSVIPFIPDTLKESKRADKVRDLTAGMKKRASENGKYEVTIKAFYGGNEYYLFVFQIYRDVRLVGAPPSSIGQFGGETDNWMWPRQTGDFTVFRIYADSLGNPANYSDKNVPLKAKYHLPISLKGIKKNDFAMTWGYPGNTSRFITSYGMDYNLKAFYPTYIKIFGKELGIMKDRMDADKAVKINYSGKYLVDANTWKNLIGQTKMLIKNKVADRKETTETLFRDWYSKDPRLTKKYGQVLDNLKKDYDKLSKIVVPYLYANLAGLSLNTVSFAGKFGALKSALEKKNKKAETEAVDILKNATEEHFKKSDEEIEKNTLIGLLKIYAQDVPKEQLPPVFQTIEKKYNNDFKAFADAVYATSAFATEKNAMDYLKNLRLKVFKKDPGWEMYQSFHEAAGIYSSAYAEQRTHINAGNRLFIAGLRQMNPDKIYYSDANSSMRMSYGQVEDYSPADAVHYEYYTTLKGVMQKEDSTNNEFIVDRKLRALYDARDYGQYGENGNMVTCFLTTNDITGGNSGSPVINGDGQLIGLAFDGNWEAMSSDISFEPALQRTIVVDIRYVLFIIDKFAGDHNLISELTIVK